MEADLLITGANIASLAGPSGGRAGAATDVGLLEDHAVAVAGDEIIWVGPSNEWDGTTQATWRAGGRLVTPGWVDAHTHLVYRGDRAFEMALKLQGKSYMEILEAGGGIAFTRSLTKDASVTELANDTAPRLERMMAQGTTTMEAKSGYALDVEGELRMLEANAVLGERYALDLASTFCGAHAVPAEFKGRTDAYVDLVVEEMLPRVAEQGIAEFCDVFVEEGVFTVEHGERIFAVAKKLGLAGRLHADEIVCTDGAQLAARSGCITADHLLRASDEGIAAMADAGTMAVMMPTVPLTLMEPTWPNARSFVAAGVPLALGTDHNPNNPVTSMQLAMQLGCYALGLTPEQALTAATWNAAASLNRSEKVGSVEVGKTANLLLHSVSDVASLVHEPGRNTVQAVVRGRTTAT